MKIDFVIPQRLLDHQQIERVELAQMLKLIERVGGIRVHTENDIRPAGADLLQHIQIPSRLHLDLDPPVSRRQLRFDVLQKLFRRVLNADRNAARDLAPRSSQQLPERQLFLPRLRVPHRVFERGFGHAVAADSGNPRRTIPTSRQLTLKQQRRQILLDRRPRGFGPFRAVKRIFPGDALAPPAHSIDLDTHQQDAAAINAAKARFKKMHEWHVNFTQSYGFYFHDLVCVASIPLEPPTITLNDSIPNLFDKYLGKFLYFRTRHIFVPMESDLAQYVSTLQRQFWNCRSTKIQKLKPGSIEARNREEQAKMKTRLQRLLRTQAANTLSPRPTPPAGTAHSPVRRVHSRAHSVPRQ